MYPIWYPLYRTVFLKYYKFILYLIYLKKEIEVLIFSKNTFEGDAINNDFSIELIIHFRKDKFQKFFVWLTLTLSGFEILDNIHVIVFWIFRKKLVIMLFVEIIFWWWI